MKKSKYNNIVEINKKKYIFNSLYDSIIEFSDKEIMYLKNNKLNMFSEEQKIILKDNGVFIEEDIDEKALIFENLKNI